MTSFKLPRLVGQRATRGALRFSNRGLEAKQAASPSRTHRCSELGTVPALDVAVVRAQSRRGSNLKAESTSTRLRRLCVRLRQILQAKHNATYSTCIQAKHNATYSTCSCGGSLENTEQENAYDTVLPQARPGRQSSQLEVACSGPGLACEGRLLDTARQISSPTTYSRSVSLQNALVSRWLRMQCRMRIMMWLNASLMMVPVAAVAVAAEAPLRVLGLAQTSLGFVSRTDDGRRRR